MRAVTDDPCSLIEAYAPVRLELEEVSSRFGAELVSRRPFLNALCNHVGRYRGKMLRPALLLLTGKAAGGITDEHLTLGAVVEMVHIATLVHDDVLDQAEMRRQQTTVNHMSGNEAAVLLGDYLISHAFHLCSSLVSTYAAREIGAATNSVCEGELTQIQHRGNTRLTESDYIDIVQAKTGALTGVCCALGARFAGAAAETVETMRRFGTEAGVAFQIIDDVLDLIGAEDRVGKTLGRDLDLGKPTLPLIHGLAGADAKVRSRLGEMIRGGSLPSGHEVVELLARNASLAYAAGVARDYVHSALRRLEVLSESPAKASLAAMVEFILRRDH